MNQRICDTCKKWTALIGSKWSAKGTCSHYDNSTTDFNQWCPFWEDKTAKPKDEVCGTCKQWNTRNNKYGVCCDRSSRNLGYTTARAVKCGCWEEKMKHEVCTDVTEQEISRVLKALMCKQGFPHDRVEGFANARAVEWSLNLPGSGYDGSAIQIVIAADPVEKKSTTPIWDLW